MSGFDFTARLAGFTNLLLRYEALPRDEFVELLRWLKCLLGNKLARRFFRMRLSRRRCSSYLCQRSGPHKAMQSETYLILAE